MLIELCVPSKFHTTDISPEKEHIKEKPATTSKDYESIRKLVKRSEKRKNVA